MNLKLSIRWLTLLFIIVWSEWATAQTMTISQPEKFNSRTQQAEILGIENNEIYIFLNKKRSAEFLIYRDDLSLKKRHLIELDLPRDKPEKFILTSHGLRMFFTHVRKNTQYLMARDFDLELKPDTIDILLDSTGRNADFRFSIPEFRESADRRRVVIFRMENPMNGQPEFQYLVVDSSLAMLSRGKLTLPGETRKSSLSEVLIDNNGRVYLVLSLFRNAGWEHAYQYWILSPSNSDSSVETTILVAPEGRFFNNTLFRFDSDHERIVAAGFYMDDYKKPEAAEGIFYTSVKPVSQTDTIAHFQEFSPEFLSRLKGIKTNRKLGRLYSFYLEEIILREDGGALLIAQSFYKTYRNTPDLVYEPMQYSPTGELAVTYHFDELVVASVNPDGGMYWKEILIKNQISVGDMGRYSSYLILNNGNDLDFIYNDRIDYSTNVVKYNVSPDGQVDRNILFNSRQADLYLLPRMGRQTGNREVIIPSLKRRKLQWVKLSF